MVGKVVCSLSYNSVVMLSLIIQTQLRLMRMLNLGPLKFQLVLEKMCMIQDFKMMRIGNSGHLKFQLDLGKMCMIQEYGVTHMGDQQVSSLKSKKHQ